jgi:hypothetical protein
MCPDNLPMYAEAQRQATLEQEKLQQQAMQKEPPCQPEPESSFQSLQCLTVTVLKVTSVTITATNANGYE